MRGRSPLALSPVPGAAASDHRSVLGVSQGAFAAYPRCAPVFHVPLDSPPPLGSPVVADGGAAAAAPRQPRQYIPGIGRRWRVVADYPGRRRDPPPGPPRSASGGAGGAVPEPCQALFFDNFRQCWVTAGAGPESRGQACRWRFWRQPKYNRLPLDAGTRITLPAAELQSTL